MDKLHKHTALCLKCARSKGNGKQKIDCNWKKIKLSPENYKSAEQFWVKKVSEQVLRLYKSGKLQSLRATTTWDQDGNFLKVITSGKPISAPK